MSNQPNIGTAVEKQLSCTDLASTLLEKFSQMRLTFDLIEGTDSTKGPDQDPGPGSMPRLELRLQIANDEAQALQGRLHRLADRISV